MKHVNAREMCKALERQGWTLQRVTGSHYIYNRPGARRPISVPKHGAKTLKTGTKKSIMREPDWQTPIYETGNSDFVTAEVKASN